jgi:hypothetical protein
MSCGNSAVLSGRYLLTKTTGRQPAPSRAADSSQKLVNIYQTKRCYIPEDTAAAEKRTEISPVSGKWEAVIAQSV